MIVTKKNNENLHKFKVKINGERLEKCNSYKYLGVYVDDQLNWRTHINHISQKISKACGVLSKARYISNHKTLKMIYYAIVYSYLQYCNIAWGSAQATALAPLQAALNKIIKTLNFASFDVSNIDSLYKSFDLLTLKQIHDLEVVKLMYKHKNELLPPKFQDYFTPVSTVHTHNTRSRTRENFFIPRTRTSIGQKLIRVEGPKIWNSLPDSIRNSQSIHSFSSSCKSYFINENVV